MNPKIVISILTTAVTLIEVTTELIKAMNGKSDK